MQKIEGMVKRYEKSKKYGRIIIIYFFVMVTLDRCNQK